MGSRRVRNVETDDQSGGGGKKWEQENNRWSRIVPLVYIRCHTAHPWIWISWIWQNDLQWANDSSPKWVSNMPILLWVYNTAYLLILSPFPQEWWSHKFGIARRLEVIVGEVWTLTLNSNEWQRMRNAVLHGISLLCVCKSMHIMTQVFHCVPNILPLCHGCPWSSLTSARLIWVRTTSAAMKTREPEWDEDEDAGEEIDFFCCFLWASTIYMNVCEWIWYMSCKTFCGHVFACATDNESAKNESGGHSSVNYGVNDILCSSGHATWRTHTNRKMAKSAPMFTQCGRQLWKELDSEMVG